MTEQREQYEIVEGELIEDGETISSSNLYGDDDQVAELAERVMMVAPWVHYRINGKDHTMSKKEVSLAIRRCMALGVDPLNPHEVQIWRDRHGLNFQLAYTLLAEWVREKGGHTEPKFSRLTDAEKDAEGLNKTDHATWCEFIMREDLDKIIALTEAGFDADDVKGMFTVRGLGVVEAGEWNSKYFAPHGRSKRWKLRKRALTDAYRKRFGTPTRAEITALRRLRAEESAPSKGEQALPYQPQNRRRDRLFKTTDRPAQLAEGPDNEDTEPEPADKPQDAPEAPQEAPGRPESEGGNGSKATKTRTGRQEFWHVYHTDGPKEAGVVMKYARNIAKKYGDDGNDWAKAISRLRDAEAEAMEKAEGGDA